MPAQRSVVARRRRECGAFHMTWQKHRHIASQIQSPWLHFAGAHDHFQKTIELYDQARHADSDCVSQPTSKS